MLFIHCCHTVAIGLKVVQYSHPAAACNGVCAIAWSTPQAGRVWELQCETCCLLMATRQNGGLATFILHTICMLYCRVCMWYSQEMLVPDAVGYR